MVIKNMPPSIPRRIRRAGVNQRYLGSCIWIGPLYGNVPFDQVKPFSRYCPGAMYFREENRDDGGVNGEDDHGHISQHPGSPLQNAWRQGTTCRKVSPCQTVRHHIKGQSKYNSRDTAD